MRHGLEQVAEPDRRRRCSEATTARPCVAALAWGGREQHTAGEVEMRAGLEDALCSK
jgi:hypothetical protein